MSTAEKINRLHKILLTLDDATIDKYLSMAERESAKEEIVAYTVQGEPLTKEMCRERIQKAETGNFTSVEDLEREVQSW